MTLWLGSASFDALLDEKGHAAAYSVKLTGGKAPAIVIQTKGMNLIPLLNLDAGSDGAKTIPASIAAIATRPDGSQVVLYSGFGSADVVNYAVKKGTAVAK